MKLLRQWFRIFLLLVITSFSLQIGYWVYTSVYDLLDFQITGYRYLLQAQTSISAGKEQLQWVVSNASNFFADILGKEWWRAEIINTYDTISIEEKLSVFEKKLQWISGTVAWAIALIVRKLLFDSIFWIKQLLIRLKLFIV